MMYKVLRIEWDCRLKAAGDLNFLGNLVIPDLKKGSLRGTNNFAQELHSGKLATVRGVLRRKDPGKMPCALEPKTNDMVNT